MKRQLLWILAALTMFLSGGANAAEIPLGAGDVVKISVFGNPDLAVETRVSDSGFITFPLIGQVQVAGQPVAAAEKIIAANLEKGGFVKKPQVNLIVTVLASQQVSVLGQVNRPGRYPLDAKRTLLDFLALAGGVTPDGSDQVTLIRKRDGNTTKEVIDVPEMIRAGKMDRDFDLGANDVIFVERAPRFYIYGEVQRPGQFRVERDMTVQQALSAGGGLTQRGTERGLVIKRRGDNGTTQTISAKPDDLVRTDDVIYVKESLF
jgi:polysaccharide export outer membrane protein